MTFTKKCIKEVLNVDILLWTTNLGNGCVKSSIDVNVASVKAKMAKFPD